MKNCNRCVACGRVNDLSNSICHACYADFLKLKKGSEEWKLNFTIQQYILIEQQRRSFRCKIFWLWHDFKCGLDNFLKKPFKRHLIDFVNPKRFVPESMLPYYRKNRALFPALRQRFALIYYRKLYFKHFKFWLWLRAELKVK